MSGVVLGPWLGHGLALLAWSALVATLAPRLHRALRVAQGARGYWLGSWALAALPTPLALLLAALLPGAVVGALPVLAPLGGLAGIEPVGLPRAGVAATPWRLDLALLAVYFAGLALGLSRAALDARAVRAWRRTCVALDPGALPGPRARRTVAALRRRGIAVLVAPQAASPFALRRPQPAIVLPHALLARLDDAQWRLVLRHEAAHLAHRDPEWAWLLQAVGLLLWFDPWQRRLARQARLAAELACDAQALGARKNMRRAYAEAYLETLRMSMAPALPCPTIAFSPQDQGSHRMRIGHIVHGDPHARKRPLRAAALALLALASGAGVTAVQASRDTTGEVAFSSAIISGRISSPYGQLRPGISQGKHNGVDLTAARGTPVFAPAAGTVRVATETYEQPRYGTVVVLDHGHGWQTVYAHLDGFDVEVGAKVAAGQQIGRVGSTGQATGPHVHVEVHHHGERVDPAHVIDTLVAAR